MNLGEAKKRALALMAEYSIDGALIPDRENADYLIRMNLFANDSQMEISDIVGIGAAKVYEQVGTAETGYNRYELPSDFKDFRRMLHKDESFIDFRIINTRLLINKAYSGAFELIYFRNPIEIKSDTPDTYEFETDKHTHSLIPYFVAGMSIHDENPTIGDRLLNIYFSRLKELEKRIEDYPNDVYSIFDMNYL